MSGGPPQQPGPPSPSDARHRLLFGHSVGAVPAHTPTHAAANQIGRAVPPSAGSRTLPPIPPVGRPEMYYARLVRAADEKADFHAHEAAKVGQYVTLAIDPNLDWDRKLRYFRHALSRHCTPPPLPDDDVWLFYRQLADLVRSHCGAEALRLASQEDDVYAAMKGLGKTEEEIAETADDFFAKLMGGQQDCPQWFNEEDWAQLKLLRDQWV